MRNLYFNIDDTNRVTAEIDIGNGLPTPIIRKVSEQKIKKHFQNKLISTAPTIYPPAVRYVSPDGLSLIWEQPPTYRTINYTPAKQHDLDASTKSKHVFRIPVPWQEYLVTFTSSYTISELYMFFRRQPLGVPNRAKGSKDDRLSLYTAPLNNFHTSNKICQAVYNELPDANNLYQMLSNVFDMVWNSGFNNDLIGALQAFSTSRCADNPLVESLGSYAKYYDRWEKYTLDDVMQWSWPIASESAIVFLDNLKYQNANISTVELIMELQSASNS